MRNLATKRKFNDEPVAPFIFGSIGLIRSFKNLPEIWMNTGFGKMPSISGSWP